MNRNQLNLALLALVAGLTLTVVLTQEEETPKTPLLALEPSAVERIAVRHPQAEEIVLERQAGQWRLTAPGQAPAEAIEVSALTDLAALKSERQLAAADVDLAELGLSPPKYEIQLNDALLQFGGIEPLEHERYVKVGETIHLISDPPSAALDDDPADLVSKQLVPAGRQIVGLVLPDLQLHRGDGSGWTLSPPQAAVSASADQMQALVDGWSRARALWNQSPDAGIDYQGKAEIQLQLDDGSQVDLVLVARDPQLILAQPKARVHHHLSKALADELLALPTLDDGEEPAAVEATES